MTVALDDDPTGRRYLDQLISSGGGPRPPRAGAARLSLGPSPFDKPEPPSPFKPGPLPQAPPPLGASLPFAAGPSSQQPAIQTATLEEQQAPEPSFMGRMREALDRATNATAHVAAGMYGASVDTGLGALRGLENVGPMLPPEMSAQYGNDLNQQLQERLMVEQQQIQQNTAALPPEPAADVVGAIGGPLAQYLGMGAAAKGLGLVQPATTLLGRILQGTASGLPLTLARAGSPELTAAGALAEATEESHPKVAQVARTVAENPLLRYGSEAALDLGGGALLESAIPVGRSAARYGKAKLAEEAGSVPGPPPKPPLVGSFDEVAGAPEPPKKPAAVDPDDYLNIAKFAQDPTGEKRLREEMTRVVQADPELNPKRVETWEEARAAARKLGIDDIVQVEGKRQTNVESLATRSIITQNLDGIKKLEAELANPSALTAEEIERHRMLIGSLETQNEGLLSRFTKGRTQAGRNLQAHRMMAEHTLDEATWLARATRALDPEGRVPLTEGQRTTIRRLIGEEDKKGLAQYVASQRKSTWLEKAVLVWKAGLLTGPPTHMANALGNTTMNLLEESKDVPAAMTDALLSVWTGQRTKSLPGLRAARASMRGAAKGVREAGQVIRSGITEDALQKYDLYRQVNFESTGGSVSRATNAFFRIYTNTVFRGLEASDKIFTGAALQRSLADQSVVLAKNERPKGGWRARATELEANPTDDMVMRAIEDAEIATFRNKGALATLTLGLKEGARRKTPYLGAAMESIIPFARTPSNVATRALEYGGGGAFAAVPSFGKLFRAVQRGEKGEAFRRQRELVDRIGRASVGVGGVVTGYLLAKNGKMTGMAPKPGTTEAEDWKREGKMENSLLVNGRWRSAQRISPFGNILSFGANIYYVGHNPELAGTDRITAILASPGKTLTEQSFMTGTREFLDFAGDPVGAGKGYIAGQMASVIPAAVRRTAQGRDPFVRDTRTEGAVEGLKREFKARIPGLSKSLPASQDALGQPLERHSSVPRALFDVFNSRVDRTQTDEFTAMLSKAGASVARRKKGKDETWDEFRERERIEGYVAKEYVKALVASPEALAELVGFPVDWDTLPKEAQEAVIEKAIEQARTAYTKAMKERGELAAAAR